jgi:hypothetical protein
MDDYSDLQRKNSARESVNKTTEDSQKKTELGGLTEEEAHLLELQNGIEKSEEFVKLDSFKSEMPQTQEDEDLLSKPKELSLEERLAKLKGGGDEPKELSLEERFARLQGGGDKPKELSLEERFAKLQGGDKAPSSDKTVLSIRGSLGGFKVGDELDPKKANTQGTHPIFKIKHNGKTYYLKGVGRTKDEEVGLSAQEEHGIAVPEHAEVKLSDNKKYQITRDVPGLKEGLFNINWYTGDDKEKLKPQQKKFLVDLGKQHIADIRVCNVDRLPWEGNSYRVNLKNIFSSMFTGELLGLDTEADMNITEEKQRDIENELSLMLSSPKESAAKIYDIISKGGKRGRLDAEELKKEDFVDAFSEGLLAGLKVEYTSPYMDVEE